MRDAHFFQERAVFMDKPISYLWSLGSGVLFLVLSIILFLLGFESLSIQISYSDYAVIFLAGVMVGAILVYFLRRSEQSFVFRSVLIAFALSLPFAMFGVVFGAVIGGIGIFLLGVSPAVFIIGIGFFLGNAIARK